MSPGTRKIIEKAIGFAATALLSDALDKAGLAVYRKKKHRHKRRPPSCVPMTEELADKIRATFLEHPTMTQHDIAVMYSVNVGRVNEVIRRVADEQVPN